MHWILRIAAIVLMAVSSTSVAAEVGRETLRTVALRVVEVFNSGDGAALGAMLTPEQREAADMEVLALRLADCRRRFGAVQRISLPVMSTWTYGLMAAYFESTVRDLFLEIDSHGNVKVLTITGADDSCSLAGPQAGPA